MKPKNSESESNLEAGKQTNSSGNPVEKPAATEPAVAQVEEDWTNFTERLTFGLYRSAATEFSKRYKAAVQNG